MAKSGTNEVKQSLSELTRIYQPTDPVKFVKTFMRKYRVSGGYEEELTRLVRMELNRLNVPTA
ncbi:hypothetical protein J31TS4_33620 [Paenibacillus sp. J31TS4]|uniref:hypothetical protein n=1 Tax=Paenibacillus sp. J31TS4 TaxID=2807195 RepID=UPI001B14BEC7|nr:hypothetical protein [Paenibacillus sp. J31TS4]GIP40082.1 hypothetical protein J31TS4_33620 [Paenibacillus sp. J31TS4]